MVVIALSPIEPTDNRQERTGLPSMCTVQAPHCAMPQPYFVPVIPSISRSTHNNGMSSGASKVLLSPLILSVVMRVSTHKCRPKPPLTATDSNYIETPFAECNLNFYAACRQAIWCEF